MNKIFIVLLALSCFTGFTQNNPELVYLDSNNELVYKEDSKGNKVPDFSTVGYMNGEKEIPTVRVVKTISPINGDNLKHIQDAIDEIEAMTPDANGFRGALLLKAGEYNVSNSLSVGKSGVVLRGEGDGTRGTVLTATRKQQHDFLIFNGAKEQLDNNSKVAIIDDYVPIGTKQITVQNSSKFKVGDRVMQQREPLQAWLKLLGTDKLNDLDPKARNWTTGEYIINYKRIITAIDGNTITLDASVVDVIDPRHARGYLIKYNWGGRIEQVGVENIRFESIFTSDTDEDHGWTAVRFNNTEHGWMRNATARYFGYGTVGVSPSSSNITVADCRNLDPKSNTQGGRKYSYDIDGQRNLVINCYSRFGRHDFVTGPQVAGPNAFVNCIAENQLADIGPHHRWATGVLFDNVVGDFEMNARNRTVSGSGHGWAGAQIMFWNCEAALFRVQDPPGDHINWCVGCKGEITNIGGNNKPLEPLGYVELRNKIVIPNSLYQAQLNARLEPVVINNKPIASFSSPSVNFFTEGYSELHIIVSASDPDGDEITTSLKIDGVEIRSESNAPYEWGEPGTPNESETLGLTIGDHVLEVVVTDSKGASITLSKIITISEEGIEYFYPIHDAYVEGTNGTNNEDLRVEFNNRKSYLKFDISSLSKQNVIEAELELTVGSDPGSGAISVNSATSNDWTENTINASTAPNVTSLLSSMNESFQVNETYSFDIQQVDFNQASLTLIVQADEAGNDVSFASKENIVYKTPRLKVKKGLITGSIDNQSTMVGVYPNPSESGLFLLSEEQNYKVYNISGLLIKEGLNRDVNISSFPRGVYFLHLEDQVIKIIK